MLSGVFLNFIFYFLCRGPNDILPFLRLPHPTLYDYQSTKYTYRYLVTLWYVLKADGRYGTGYSFCLFMWLSQIAVLQKYRSETLFGSLQTVDTATVSVSCIMPVLTIQSARWTANMRTPIVIMVTELVSKIQSVSLF